MFTGPCALTTVLAPVIDERNETDEFRLIYCIVKSCVRGHIDVLYLPLCLSSFVFCLLLLSLFLCALSFVVVVVVMAFAFIFAVWDK